MASGDRGEKAMLGYMKKNKVNFPSLKLEHLKIAKKYGIKGYPWMIVIDENGKQIINEVGFSGFSKLKNAVK